MQEAIYSTCISIVFNFISNIWNFLYDKLCYYKRIMYNKDQEYFTTVESRMKSWRLDIKEFIIQMKI